MKPRRFHYANLLKHAVMPLEADEALLDGWHRRRKSGANYEVLGRTEEGRYLQLVVEDGTASIWVFHARDMTETERKRYMRK